MFYGSMILKEICRESFLPNTKISVGMTDEWLFRSVNVCSKSPKNATFVFPNMSKYKNCAAHFKHRSGDQINPFGGMRHGQILNFRNFEKFLVKQCLHKF